MSGTTIIREAPRARRSGGRTPAGFVLRAPSLRRLTIPLWEEAVLGMSAYPTLMLGLVVAGALLWPMTLAGLTIVAPPMAVFFREQRPPTPDEMTHWIALSGLGAGALVGTIQSVLLRRTALGTPFWIPAATLGWALGTAAMVRAVYPLTAWINSLPSGQRFVFWAPRWERYAMLAMIGAILGLVFGLAQWLALRHTKAPLRRRWVWIVASVLAWAIGLPSVPMVPQAPYFVMNAGRFSGGFDATMPGLMLAGALYGLLTGVALTLLLRAAVPRPVET